MHVCSPLAGLVAKEARTGHQIFKTRVTHILLWVLRIEPRFSARAARTLNCRATSSALALFLKHIQ